MIKHTPKGFSANISNTSDGIYVTFCRAHERVDWNSLAVSDVCLILPKKVADSCGGMVVEVVLISWWMKDGRMGVKGWL